MRSHVLGWIILGLALFVDGPPGIAAWVAGTQDTRRAAPAPAYAPVEIPAVAIGGAVAGSDFVPGAASRTRSGEPEIAPARREPGSVADAARPFVTHPALPVREFAPGSKAHAEAIARNIASEEFQDLVSPLARLYLAYFGRVPDYEGLDYYIGERDRGESLEAIADEFAASAEFNARYGALDNGAFVDRVHRNVFGFPPGADQRAHWVDLLDSGRLTRGEVMLINSESLGYVAMSANEVFVAIAYAETLGRAPEPADLSRWVRFLDAGNPRDAVIGALLADRGGR